MIIVFLVLSLLLLNGGGAQEARCKGERPGDCDPKLCGGTCEARYIRFFDSAIKGDRTVKRCECAQEKICQIIGMHAYAGCRSYATLSTAGQRLIRLWSMDFRDRRNRFSNDLTKRYNDKVRHQQLLYGNSRFCCRTVTGKVAHHRYSFGPNGAKAMHLRSHDSPRSIVTSLTVAMFIAVLFLA